MFLQVWLSENQSNHQRSLTFSWTKTNSQWAPWFDTKPHTSQKIESAERIILEYLMITARNIRMAHLRTESNIFENGTLWHGLISEETPDWGKPRQTPPITIQCGDRSHVLSRGAKITQSITFMSIPRDMQMRVRFPPAITQTSSECCASSSVHHRSPTSTVAREPKQCSTQKVLET